MSNNVGTFCPYEKWEIKMEEKKDNRHRGLRNSNQGKIILQTKDRIEREKEK